MILPVRGVHAGAAWSDVNKGEESERRVLYKSDEWGVLVKKSFQKKVVAVRP